MKAMRTKGTEVGLGAAILAAVLGTVIMVGFALGFAVLVSFAISMAHAKGPPEKWVQVNPGTREWFKSLHNDYGMSCCDIADGNRLDDPDWRQDDNVDDEPRYSVKLFDQWWPVDPKKVLKGTNRVGYAILWRPQVEMPQDGSAPPIYCFLPGQRV